MAKPPFACALEDATQSRFPAGFNVARTAVRKIYGRNEKPLSVRTAAFLTTTDERARLFFMLAPGALLIAVIYPPATLCLELPACC